MPAVGVQAGEDPLIGRTLAGRYRIVRALGEGEMGAVYEAIQAGLGRRVALKVLSDELSGEEVFLERFRREAEASARLMHPNIVQVTDFVQHPGEPVFIVMELLHGRPLQELLKRGPVPPARACALTIQLASALETAHGAGITHRDLKPANVFLVPIPGGEEVVKLLDFGIAKLKESDGYSRLTQTGVLIGTPRFASPEQAAGRGDVDARSDIFSLGVLLYGMLTGRPPFTSHGAQLLMDIQEHEPPDPRVLVPELPPALVGVVQRAMRKRPEDRYRTVGQMRAALESFVQPFAQPAAQPPVSAAPSPAARAAAASPDEQATGAGRPSRVRAASPPTEATAAARPSNAAAHASTADASAADAPRADAPRADARRAAAPSAAAPSAGARAGGSPPGGGSVEPGVTYALGSGSEASSTADPRQATPPAGGGWPPAPPGPARTPEAPPGRAGPLAPTRPLAAVASDPGLPRAAAAPHAPVGSGRSTPGRPAALARPATPRRMAGKLPIVIAVAIVAALAILTAAALGGVWWLRRGDVDRGAAVAAASGESAADPAEIAGASAPPEPSGPSGPSGLYEASEAAHALGPDCVRWERIACACAGHSRYLRGLCRHARSSIEGAVPPPDEETRQDMVQTCRANAAQNRSLCDPDDPRPVP